MPPRLLAAESDQTGIDFFEKKIRPALVENCYQCHSVEAETSGKLKGGLRLDSADALRTGGDSGPAIMPGNAEKSLLVSAIRHDDLEMPPERKLSDNVIADFVRWIEMGAPWPDEARASVAAESEIDWNAARQFWSFQRPTRHPLPQVQDAQWPRRPMDYFVLAGIEDAGLTPNETADPRTLIRRATFDLTGLPPTPNEVEAFVQASIRNQNSAIRNLMDRLLASPRYGEHLARLWLDLARYAEDQAHIVGNNNSLTYPNAYLYRDWVIAALNDDLPYDEFVKLQLAADLLQPDDRTNRLHRAGAKVLPPQFA